MSFIPVNIVDIAIIIFIIFSVIDGFRRGILTLIADLVALVVSILVALQIYQPLAPLVTRLFKVPEQAGKVIAFFIVAFVLANVLTIVFGLILKLIPSIIRGSLPDKIVGAVGGFAKGFIYVGIILLLISSLPIIQPVKEMVAASNYAPAITTRTKVVAASLEGSLKGKFGGLVEDTFTLLTVNPGEKGLDLGFKTSKYRVDEQAENEMLRLLNGERVKVGLQPVIVDAALREAARAHSKDMFERGYFAHETPEGTTPAQRLDKRDIDYGIMGENLALAPDVNLAHKGLMNSPSHRENILFPDYEKIGIGAINGGIYGIMFSQEFTD